MKGRAIPAKCHHRAKKLAEGISASQNQLIGGFNWCLLGASHGLLLTLPGLTAVGVVVPTFQIGKGTRLPKVTQEVREQNFKIKSVIQRPGSFTTLHRWMVPEFLNLGLPRVWPIWCS